MLESTLLCPPKRQRAQAFVLAAVCLGAQGADKPKSGPPIGGKTPSFNVHGVTGMGSGGKICYI